MNRLASATSPYLRQHADNPVDWREWDSAVFEEATERDVPILLSVGYSACHWCHVMAHESFEDEATAALLNENFVCVKVDREERPDIDAVYMAATVAITGQGGWPMTCFLTPHGEPFHCGTYYPNTPRAGMPTFMQVLEAIIDLWRRRRDEVDQVGGHVAQALRGQLEALPAGELPVTGQLLGEAVQAVLAEVDEQHGGFGTAPKFPPSALLEGLLRHVERTGGERVVQVVTATATAMARGGIYDQLGGGFARYSVDAAWVVPHFEKMLYDNALLLRCYAHLARRWGGILPTRIATETAQFLLAELLTDTGGFAAALDADTPGTGPSAEGATYVWSPQQLTDVLGDHDSAWAADFFGVTAEGTCENGTSVLTRRRDPNEAEVQRFQRAQQLLRAARDQRPQPARDDKVVTAWNGMAMTALAEAGAALEHPEWVSAAGRCARFLLDRHLVAGRLVRASRDGRPGAAAGVLEDYAWLVTGLLALHQATGGGEWLESAEALLDTAIARFADPDHGGSWFDTADDAEALVVRPRDPFDGATPAGASAMAEALLTASALAGPARAGHYRALADATLATAAVLLARAPRSAGHWLAVAEAALRGPLQIAIALPRNGSAPDHHELLATARKLAPGGSVVLAAQPDSVPLLADRPTVSGQAAAYVCRGSVCDLPVTDPAALQRCMLTPR